MTRDEHLAELDKLAGSWDSEATHPAMPGLTVRGVSTFEWLDGHRFLIYRVQTDHPKFPDAISVIGYVDNGHVDEASGEIPSDVGTSTMRMHYFDTRGVFRDYAISIDGNTWKIWRDDAAFAQRFTGTISDDGNTIEGLWQLCRDQVNWQDDLKIIYRRRTQA
jgi:hypothetical protein